MKIENGVMIVKDGTAWGKVYEDGREINYWWVPIEDAELYDPDDFDQVTDVANGNSRYIRELLKGRLVKVKRTITVEVFDD